MKLVSFEYRGSPSFGMLEGDEVLDLSGAHATSLKEALALGPVKRSPDGRRLPMSEVKLLPPILTPAKIFCIGVNYDDHRIETGRAKVDYPTVFTRFADTQVPHDGTLIRPLASEEFDFEGELAVIIGKGGRRIAEAEALSHVAGYACYNDGSVRDWQNRTSQFTPGKNFPATGGFGPWLVTADEIPDPQALTLTTRLNGEVVQQASTRLMIFSVAAVIAYLSEFTALSPGDVIATGTPAGVGAKRSPPLWMKDGDVVEVEIERIGTLRNRVAAER
jgi:2-keto-4-pentenoate hydratase/2-oxohepta-3-ene-1,7-dioic acid hydratase in catechol pathway